ncbi:MAG TPA: hypothetical protein VHB54_13825 [Mucilaginibacter sp.]|nr:hypothetical protein [Mucilaginibacter sp.]
MVPRQQNGAYGVVVTHYVAAAMCFLLLAGMITWSRSAFTGHYFQPHILAVTHLAALGWGTCIIFGACYQLVPVVLETELHSIKLSWLSFSLFLPGVACLVHSFWIFVPGIWMQTGALLVLVSVILFTLNVYLTAIKAKKQTIQEDFIFSACLCLCITALVGAALVFNFTMAFLAKDQLHYLRLHAHLGLAGWFLLMVMGVSSKLVPMFLVSSYQNDRLLKASYYLVVAALLLFLADAYFFGLNIKTYFIALIGAAGIGCHILFVYKCYQKRIRKSIDLPMKGTLLSFILLCVAILCIPFIIFYYLHGDKANVELSLVYGVLLIMGWLTSLILGQTFKTLPFIIWVRRYEHMAGKAKTPMPSDLFKTGLLRLQTIAFAIFCIGFVPGCLFQSAIMITIGCVALLVAAAAYLVNVLIVILHRTKTYDEL